ncbi:hypothetical protein SCHPADRAFT_664594, partial [Schizopora paradoxa]
MDEILSRGSQNVSDPSRALAVWHGRTTLGLLSLPNELLSMCFEHAIDEDFEDGPFVALRLSHISSRCRAIALGNTKIWATLHHDTSMCSLDFTEACISRSGRSPLTVAVTFSDKKLSNRITATQFLELLEERNILARCRRVIVILSCNLKNGLEEFDQPIFIQEEIGSKHFGSCVFFSNVTPDYVDVRIDQDHWEVSDTAELQLSLLLGETFLDSMAERCQLKHLTVPALPTLFDDADYLVHSLSSLHFVLEHKLDVSAVAFLACFPALQDLEVTLTVYGVDTTSNLFQEHLPFPSICNLRFRLHLLFEPEDEEYVESHFELINCIFPNAFNMDLLLEFRTDIPYQGFQEYVLRSEWDFTPLLDSLFPHKHRYASLENLSVTFKVADLAGVPAIEIRDSPVGAAVFPLRNLPSLKNFEV